MELVVGQDQADLQHLVDQRVEACGLKIEEQQRHDHYLPWAPGPRTPVAASRPTSYPCLA